MSTEPLRQYIAIDLKSFYASVECVERGLDPLDTCLVVADASRTEKTICLAVSPALKEYGTGGRPRLFEVIEKVRLANRLRGNSGKSHSKKELDRNKSLAIDYVVAPPRMAHYIEYSTKIYDIYLKYISPDDIHVYSIDEVFIDATNYLKLYRLTPDLIENNKVFIAESPLYEITSKDKTYFAYNEREKEQFLQELAGQKYTIQRSKGLGENDPDMMNLTTMNPKTRRLIQVKPGDIQQAAQMFDVLLGDNLNGRKDYIAQHGSEYLDDLDVS